MIYITILIGGLVLWFMFKFELRSLITFNTFLVKGWDGIVSAESNHIQCPDCENVVKRGKTTPYCTHCRSYL